MEATHDISPDHPREYTLREVVDALVSVVDTVDPEFRYIDKTSPAALDNSDCYYVPKPEYFAASDVRSQTGCLVGRTLTVLGVPDELFSDSTESADALADGLHYDGHRIVGRARDLLQEAQFQQDRGATWSNALQIARECWDPEMQVEPDTTDYDALNNDTDSDEEY